MVVPGEATLIEREAQMAQLSAQLSSAGRGDGRIAALLGEAGVGKTSLVEAFLRSLARDIRTLRSACEDLTLPDPLGPLHDLARDAGWILPETMGPAQRIPLFSEALRVFDRPPQPTVIVIEDIHWADDATLDLVRFVGRRAVNRHILVLVTARTDSSEGQKRARRALSDIPADRLARIEVPLLSEAAVAALARAVPADAMIVPGHGELVDVEFLGIAHEELAALDWLIREAHGDGADVAKVAAASSLARWGGPGLREAELAVRRGYAQLDALSLR